MAQPASAFCESLSKTFKSKSVFELQILFGNLLLPVAVVIASRLVAQLLPARLRPTLSATVVAIGGGVAIWAAIAIRNGFAWWPEDAWQQVPIAALTITAVVVVADQLRSRNESSDELRTSDLADKNVESIESLPASSTPAFVQCIAIALAAAASAWLIYPSAETWAELQSQRTLWCLVIALATSLAWWGIAGCKAPLATTVGFATLPLLVVAAFLTSLSIMKVTEPLIAVAAVLGVCSILDLRFLKRKSLPLVFAPALFAMSGFIAHANFQSYLHLPRTLYFLAMLSPAVVALVARMTQRKSTRFAIACTIGLALLLASGIAAWTYVAGDVGAESEW